MILISSDISYTVLGALKIIMTNVWLCTSDHVDKEVERFSAKN